MGVNGFGNAAPSRRLLAHQFPRLPLDMAARNTAREEPWLGLRRPPPVAKDFQQLGREHDVPVLLSLALLHANDHALTVDVGRPQADDLGDAQSRGVASRQNRSMFGAAHAAQKSEHLLPAQDYPPFLRLLRRPDDVPEVPLLLEGGLVEE